MNQSGFGMDEFMNPPADAAGEASAETSVDLDVQKAVVESLAADKAAMEEKFVALEAKFAEVEKAKNEAEAKKTELEAESVKLNEKIDRLDAECRRLRTENIELSKGTDPLKAKIAKLEADFAPMKEALAKVGDVLSVNAPSNDANQVALIDRDPELKDRFEGETRDHVLEVLKEARDQAEAAGRVRRAQILESVLVANEPAGNLKKNREDLVKFFADHGNILSGPVLEELQKRGISHKKGEEYLLPNEIIARTF